MSNSILDITRTALSCPLGLNGQAALAAMQAGIVRFERSDDLESTVSRLATLELSASRGERMCALLRYAMAELGLGFSEEGLRALPLFLALPEKDSGAAFDEQALLSVLQHEILASTGLPPILTSKAVNRRGRAGLFTALKNAAEALQGGDFAVALVGAVDSLVDPDSVSQLAARGWLLGRTNMDGRIATEAAGFFLVRVPRDRSQHRSLASVLKLEEGQDPVSYSQVQAGTAHAEARGLTRIFHRLHQTFPARVDGVFSAQPGEGFWGREFSYAYLRNADFMPEPLRMESVGTYLGDSGAAAGAVALLRAVASFYPPKWSHQNALASALVYGVADNGALGACLIGSPQRGM